MPNLYPFQPVPWGNHQANDFDVRTRKILNGEPIVDDGTLESILETASPEQLRKLYDKVGRSNQEKAAAEQSRRDANTFVHLHKEWIDSTENAHQVRTHAMTAFNTPHPTLEQLEASYAACLANGLVTVNQAELARQEDEAAKLRAKTIRKQAFNAEEAEKLSMDELRRRANAEAW